VAKTSELIATVKSGDVAAFRDCFDARLIRRHRELFAPYEERLRRLTQTEILSLKGLGMGPALARASVVCVDPAGGLYQVRWNWPQQRFSEECILAICPQEPGPGDDPGGVLVYHRLPIDRGSWEAGGGNRQVHLPPEWAAAYVVVWALVDLGFERFSSHPLVLGRVRDATGAPAPGWKGWSLLSSLRGKRPQAASGEHGGV